MTELRGENLGVFAHGDVVELNPKDAAPHPDWAAVLAHLTDHHGSSPLTWGDVVYYRLEPHWMTVYAPAAAG